MRLRIWLGRIQVTFHFWFFAVLLLFVLLDHYVLAWYIALPVIIHESGHLIAILLCGMHVKGIDFTPLSINICREESWVSFSRELVVNLGGVAANLLVALWLYLRFFQSMRIMFLIAANLAVAIFNLLPIGDLDGGLICRLVCERFFLPYTARNISRGVSFLVLTPLFAVSILLVLTRTANFTILVTCIYLTVTVIFRE